MFCINQSIAASSTLTRLSVVHLRRSQHAVIAGAVASFVGGETKTSGGSAQVRPQLIPIFTAVISTYQPKSMDAIPLLSRLIESLLEVIRRPLSTTGIGSGDDESVAVQSCIECIAGVFNKLPPKSPEHTTIANVMQREWLPALKSTTAQSVSSITLARSIEAFVWCTKALVLRADSSAPSIELCSLLAHPDYSIAKRAADAFELIMSDAVSGTAAVLSRETAATISLLYKQKFFALSIPHLLSMHSAALPAAAAGSVVKPSGSESSTTRVFVLLAASNLLRHLPQSVLLDSLKQVVRPRP